MRKITTKMMSCLLAAVMAGSLTACGRTDGNTKPTGESLTQSESVAENAGNDEDGEATKATTTGAEDAQKSTEEMFPEVDLTIGGEISVSVYEAEEWLKAAASEFMIKYPDTTVVIHDFKNGTTDIYSDSGIGGDDSRPTGQTREDYIAQLNTQIMSGEAEDVILTSSGIPIERYIQMGVFEDLSPYLASATEITDENYYMNIFEACRAKDGGLYQFPLAAMATPLMMFDKELMENTGVSIPEDTIRMNVWDALDLAKEMYERSTLPNTFMTDANIRNLFTKAAMDGMDYQTGTVEFDRDRMRKILEMLRELQNYEMMPMDFNYSEEYHIPFTYSYLMDLDAAMFEVNKPDGWNDVVLQSECDDGKVYLCPYYALDFGVNSASENKGTAWAFLKFLVSDEIQTLPSLSWAGVNKTGLHARVEGYMKAGNSSPADEEIQAVFEQLESWIVQINGYRQEDSELITLTESVMFDFMDGRLTVDETLDDLKAKLEQFMSE